MYNAAQHTAQQKNNALRSPTIRMVPDGTIGYIKALETAKRYYHCPTGSYVWITIWMPNLFCVSDTFCDNVTRTPCTPTDISSFLHCIDKGSVILRQLIQEQPFSMFPVAATHKGVATL